MDVFTDREIAAKLRKHPRTIQRWCRRGELPGAYKAGRSWRIPAEALGHELRLDRQSQWPDEVDRTIVATRDVCEVLLQEAREANVNGDETARDWRKTRGLATSLAAVLAEFRDESASLR